MLPPCPRSRQRSPRRCSWRLGSSRRLGPVCLLLLLLVLALLVLVLALLVLVLVVVVVWLLVVLP